MGVSAFILCNRHRWHIKQKNKPRKHTKQIFPEQKTKTSFALHHLCPVHEVLTGSWNPLISAQIVNSFGQGKCTFDCQSGNLKKLPLATIYQQAHACWSRIERLITFNIAFMWTFYTNSLLHEYLLLMHVHKYNYINTFINDLVFFTVIIQC